MNVWLHHIEHGPKAFFQGLLLGTPYITLKMCHWMKTVTQNVIMRLNLLLTRGKLLAACEKSVENQCMIEWKAAIQGAVTAVKVYLEGSQSQFKHQSLLLADIFR